ncbi:DegT/DnrJ/EryC1/StrS family aminotransferase [Paenibacillus sp. KN14-4R]|uniref:DegT/DnrJ/EryC1/StrS family aminotransferase n=1 Tax=Paenibacillus sp. KN14-4R TaxID=3445773 RepID=UPI003F9F0E3B
MSMLNTNQMPIRSVPLLDTVAEYNSLKVELDAAVSKVLASGHYILGPEVKALEREVADFCGTQFGIGVANGTDALLLLLDALGIGPGDEVITTPFTFFASSEVISQIGATPVFVDIDPISYNLCAEKLEAVITPRTKAIIPVHIFGQPADMDLILEVADRHGIAVIEDACQAIGSSFKDRRSGSMGLAGCFSFFPTKNLGGYGDGGMIVTNDEELAKKLQILRAHGSKKKYYHSMVGYNSRLDEIQAALLRVKLPHLPVWNEARRVKADRYKERLAHLPIQLPHELPDRYSIYHLFIIQTDERDSLLQYLQQNGIGAGAYYPVALHLQEVYQDLGYQLGSLPEAEYASQRTLALPLHPHMASEDQDWVIEVVERFFSERG